MLGLHPEDGGLRFDPCIPPEWPGFEATVRLGESEVHVVVENPDRVSRGVRKLSLGGVELTSPLVHFVGATGQKHEVHIVLGQALTTMRDALRSPEARVLFDTTSVVGSS